MIRRLLAFAALLGWCEALLVLRVARSHSYVFVFLTWNLFLAVVPYVAAELLERLDRRAKWRVMQWLAFVVWLLFLPNAPYIVTDFLHLLPRPPIPLWYDVLLLISCSGTGLLLGYGSVMLVQRVVERRFTRVIGWTVSIVALVLSAFGIYLGRFLRWNSWEAFTEPRPLFEDIVRRLMNPLDHPKTFAVTVLFGIALTLGYIALHVLVEDRPARDA